MRWHIELLIEAVLLGILWGKDAPRWFSVLIGVDFVAGVLQLIPNRFGLLQHSRIIWAAGILVACPLQFLALNEAADVSESIPRAKRFRHQRLMAFWVVAQLACVSLQTQAAFMVPVNHALLTIDALCFLAWAALFLIE